MNPLLGLTKSINDRETAIRDLSILERFGGQVEAQKEKEKQAQIEEQAFYERMYAQSSQLLEKDRKRINKRILMQQNQLTNHLNDFGGSRADFMQQGGLSIMNTMANNILQSDEMVRYQENQKNLMKILEAKEKGFGHLLTSTDIKNLEAYEQNEDGAIITYSGIMNEVEIPPSNLFDYGTEIPIEDIVGYGSNAIKIRNNYSITYPDRPEPSEAQLIDFAKEMGYGGYGSNTAFIKERMLARQKQKEYKAEKDKRTHGLLNEINQLINRLPSDLTISSLKEKGSVIESIRSKEPGIGQFLGNKFTSKSRRRSLGRPDQNVNPIDGLYEVSDFFSQDMMGIKDSYELAISKNDQMKIAQEIIGGNYQVENGKILEYIPNENTYKSDGYRMRNDSPTYKGNYQILGLVTGFKSKVTDGDIGNEQDIILMNAYDDNGKLDEKSTNKLYQKEDGSNPQSTAKMGIFLALRGENEDDIIYEEANLEQIGIRNAFSNSIGPNDDITKLHEQGQKSDETMAAIEAMTTEEQLAIENAKSTMEKQVFSRPKFEYEGERYWGAGSAGSKNRENMMKSFYMSFDFVRNKYKRDEKNPNGDPNIYSTSMNELVDNEWFSHLAQVGKIDNKLKDYSQGNTEEGIIDEWLYNINSTEDKDSLEYKQHQEIANKWKQMLSMFK